MPMLQKMEIGRAHIKDVNLINFIWEESLEIFQIDLASVNLALIKPDTTKELKSEKELKSLMDSIKLPGIKNISLNHFIVRDMNLHELDAQDGDTLSSYRSKDIHIKGIGFRKYEEEDSHTFTPELNDMVFLMGEQQFLLDNGLYSIVFDSLVYVHKNESLDIDKLRIAPHISVDSFARRNAGKNYDRISLELNALHVEGLGLHRIISTGALKLQKLEVDSLQMDLFRDRSHPIDPNLNIPLPNKMLEDLGIKQSIDTLRFNGPKLSYYEKLPDSNRHLETYLTGLKGEIRNIRSATWALESDEPLEISLQSYLLGAIELDMDFEFPYGKDAFYMHGRTSGSSDLASMNPTLVPAMNIRFGEGRLDGLSFQARGNSHHMEGELIMLYSNLEVELLRQNKEKNKTMSWIANAVVKQSNPNKKGKTLKATIYAERDANREFIKYIMKGVRSGIVNTFNFLGKNRRE